MGKRLLLLTAIIIMLGCSNGGDETGGQKPVISYISINDNGDAYNNKPTTIKVTIDENRNEISSVDFYIDGKLSKSVFSKPYEYNDVFIDLKTGEHSVDIVVNCSNGEKVNKTGKFKFKVSLGDEYQGGVIIKLENNGVNGVIAAKNDLQGGVLGKYRYGLYREDYQSYSSSDGFANTQNFKGKTDSNIAAIACLNHSGGGYSDWYLPALEEIQLLDAFEETLIIKRVDNIYWTSTLRSDDTHADVHFFGRAAIILSDLDIYSNLYYVRPFRRF